MSNKTEIKPDHITLGSGELYYKEFTDGDPLPTPEEMCIDTNYFACIKGGATLTYTPEFYTATDDSGDHKKTCLTSEDVILKTGIMVFNGNTLNVLSETGRVTEDANKKRRTLKVGGLKNAKGKKYIFCFYHRDKQDGDIWVFIVGNNQSGFEIAFALDSETVIDAEIKALPHDSDGTLITYIEEDKKITASTPTTPENEVQNENA